MLKKKPLMQDNTNKLENLAEKLKLTKFTRKYWLALVALQKTTNLFGHFDITVLCESYLILINRCHKAKGDRNTTTLAKALYNEATRFASGLRLEPATSLWLKRSKDNFPCQLHPFKEHLLRGGLQRRIALSILRVYETIELPVVPNLATITSPSTGKAGFASFTPSFKLFCKSSWFSKKLRLNFQKGVNQIATRPLEVPVQKTNYGPTNLHLSTKKGIKGPTCTTAGYQAQAIDDDMLQLLVRLRSKFITDKFEEVFEDNYRFTQYHGDISGNRIEDREILENNLGKISFIPDGIKTRTIAIGNYWIQEVLKFLHGLSYKLLSELATDGTYNQGSQFSRVQEASKRTGVWSFDLTAATDRFPIEIQVEFLKSLDEEVGSLWEEILRDLPFLYESQTYTYAVGQPMGLYSSWAVFALTHHAVIQYAAWLENLKDFSDYAVLGDDVAIWNPKVAERYRGFLTKLDVTISETKSFIPEHPYEPCIAEFAKRFSNKGEEFTPISPKQTQEAWNSYYEIPGYLDWLATHGFEVGSIPVSRIDNLMRLTPHQMINLRCLLTFWEYLGAPHLEGVTVGVPEDLKPYLNKRNFINLRLQSLREQAVLIKLSLKEDRAALEKRLASPFPENHYFLLILQTRLRSTEALILDLKNLFSKADPENPTVLPLSELEYLPFSTFKYLLEDMSSSESKQVLKGRYISKLVKSARRQGSLGLPSTEEYFPDVPLDLLIGKEGTKMSDIFDLGGRIGVFDLNPEKVVPLLLGNISFLARGCH